MRGRAFLLFALAALFAGGCGAREPDPVADAAKRLAEAGTSRWSMTAGHGGDVVRGEGVADYEHDRAHFTFTGTISSGGWGGTEDKKAEFSAEYVILGDRGYIKADGLPFFHAPKSKPWIEMRLDQYTSLEDQVFRIDSDPRELMETLREASARVEEDGRAFVRGVDTRHYRLAIDLGMIVAAAPRGKRRDLAMQLLYRDTKEMRAELWVDANGLVRRVRVDDGESSGETVVEFYDFGVEVAFEPPPAELVTTTQELEEQAADGEVAVEDYPDLKEADANGDGKVTDEEVETWEAEDREEEFPLEVGDDRELKQADTNGDGKVTEAEYDEWIATEDEFPLEVADDPELKEADADGDGKVSEAEMNTWYESEEFEEEYPLEVGDDEELKEADTDGDGKVTEAEMNAWYEDFDESPDFPLSLKDEPWLSAADTNDDGEVTEAEFDAWAG